MVSLRCLHEQAFLRIEVIDTGIGITQEQIHSIFEDFYQARSTAAEATAQAGSQEPH